LQLQEAQRCSNLLVDICDSAVFHFARFACLSTTLRGARLSICEELIQLSLQVHLQRCGRIGASLKWIPLAVHALSAAGSNVSKTLLSVIVQLARLTVQGEYWGCVLTVVPPGCIAVVSRKG
jgi:hypothetical protein